MCRPERKICILKSYLIKKFSAIFILMFVLTACTEDTAEKSNVDGVSDDVYEQLIQHYFNAELTMDLMRAMSEKKTKTYTKIMNYMQPQKSTQKKTTRSEEHTSELQSRGHLVCRLLLEK